MPNTYGRQVVIVLTNKSGGSVAAGDVVVIDTTTDDSFTTTTTGRAELSVGIAQETIASNAVGRVLVSGYAALINVPASVTRGHYIETHTVVKQATGSATRRSGSFGQFGKTSATPSGLIWGNADQTAAGGTAGALVFLQAQTASASAQLDFTSFISSTYDEYQIEFVQVIPATNAVTLIMRMGTGAGPTWDSGSNYSWTNYRWNAAGSTFAATNPDTGITINNSTDTISNSANYGLNGTVRLFNPGGAIYKRVTGQVDYLSTNLEGVVLAGAYLSTTAVTGVRFLMSSGNITSGIIRVYGIAKT